jgi:hypothetical protein
VSVRVLPILKVVVDWPKTANTTHLHHEHDGCPEPAENSDAPRVSLSPTLYYLPCHGSRKPITDRLRDLFYLDWDEIQLQLSKNIYMACQEILNFEEFGQDWFKNTCCSFPSTECFHLLEKAGRCSESLPRALRNGYVAVLTIRWIESGEFKRLYPTSWLFSLCRCTSCDPSTRPYEQFPKPVRFRGRCWSYTRSDQDINQLISPFSRSRESSCRITELVSHQRLTPPWYLEDGGEVKKSRMEQTGPERSLKVLKVCTHSSHESFHPSW